MELSFHGRVLDSDDRQIFKYTSYIDCQLTLAEVPLKIRVTLPGGEIKVVFFILTLLQEG